jgi:hypothetical protein
MVATMRASLLRLAIAIATTIAACDGSGESADAGADASVSCPQDAAPACLLVDDAGLSHGCGTGGMGPGDRDDGGGMTAPPPPDLGVDVRNQPFGAPCLFNAQCTSNICFLYRVKGQFCTQTCSCNADCPPPSLGCGGMGVCRVGN